jgi:hypothetical protein
LQGEVYLVPIESDLVTAESMIPLKWLYKKLEECKARQKLLVLDVCRINMARGEERPAFGTMTNRMSHALTNPPEGVQVWSSCIEGQQSYEFEEFRINNSVFMDCLYRVADSGLDEVTQHPDEPIPVTRFVEQVNDLMKKELDPLKLVQTSRLAGSIRRDGAPYNPNEWQPPEPEVVPDEPKEMAESTVVRSILKEIAVPPIKKQQPEGVLRYEALPPYRVDLLRQYPPDNSSSAFRDAIERAQAALWVISPNTPPAELSDGVRKLRQAYDWKDDLLPLKESYRAPPHGVQHENAFRNEIINDQRRIASVLRVLEDELKLLQDAGAMRKDATRRWQANYDFMLARFQTQVAYVYEYSSMLGAMRKEFPQRDPTVHIGWRMASRKKLQGDGTGRKLIRESEKLLDRLIEEHKGTPWEVLARRERLTALGLAWQPN